VKKRNTAIKTLPNIKNCFSLIDEGGGDKEYNIDRGNILPGKFGVWLQ